MNNYAYNHNDTYGYQDDRHAPQASNSPPELNSHKDKDDGRCGKYYKFMTRVFRVITVITLVLSVCAISLVIHASFKAGNLGVKDKAFVFISKLGWILYCVVLAAFECQIQFIKQAVPVLGFYLGRGFALLWLGIELLSSVSQLTSAIRAINRDANPTSVSMFGNAIGWIQICIGLTYCVFGCLCLNKIFGLSKSNPDTIDKADEKSIDENLFRNLCLAMNLTPSKAQELFGGPDGNRAAQNYALQHNNIPKPGTQPSANPYSDSMPMQYRHSDSDGMNREMHMTVSSHDQSNTIDRNGFNRRKQDTTSLEQEYYNMMNKSMP